MAIDESESDDGALHALFQGQPLDVIIRSLFILLVLSKVRGPIGDEVRARAQALADDPLFPQRDHPIITRILGAP